MNEINVNSRIPKIYIETLPKAKDGTCWFYGTPESVEMCKTGDFVLNPQTAQIYICTQGGTNFNGTWELAVGLDVSAEVLTLVMAQPEYRPWWFGTADAYNKLTNEERNADMLFFIEEGS